MRGQRRETIPMSKYWREQTLTTKSELLMCLAKNTYREMERFRVVVEKSGSDYKERARSAISN